MPIPTGYAKINPFIICDDADGAMRFISEVFDAVEHVEARTMDPDGLLVHAELRVGDGSILFCDRKPDWPYVPSTLQIYVDDVEATLARAEARGGRIITPPTEFFGGIFSRMLDPWGNGWWVYDIPEDPEGADASWQEEYGAGDDDDLGWEPTPELTLINETMHTMFRSLVDPRTQNSAG
ncbi:MAG: VOC family protein [Propionibacteriaceae bacterium]|nr:VOC family protein [Propionibacteriaceae bacterium]